MVDIAFYRDDTNGLPMTDITAGELPVPAPAGRKVPEFEPQAATASLLLINILLTVILLAVLWTPAVIFWAALALAPTALIAILAITRGWLN